MFIIILMARKVGLSALRDHAREQLGLLEECRRRTKEACPPEACSAWVGVFLRVSRALTETALVLGRIEAAPEFSATALAALKLRLPVLPPPPPPSGVPLPRKRGRSKAGRRAAIATRGRPASTRRNSATSGASSPPVSGCTRRRWRCCAPSSRRSRSASSTKSSRPRAATCARGATHEARRSE